MQTTHPTEHRRNVILGGIVATASVLALAGVVALVILVSRSQEPAAPPPDEILAVVPEPGGTALPQGRIGVKTLPAWSCELVVDGVRIPEKQFEGTAELGECYFRPAAEQIFETLEPGAHSATVTVFSLEDPGDRRIYRWSFRTT